MKKTAVITVIMILALVACLLGCAKTNPEAATESTSQTLQIPETGQTPSATAAVNKEPDVLNKSVRIPEETVLVNEWDDDKGLVYLGLTGDEVYTILEDNSMYYNAYESDTGDHVVDFHLFDGFFFLMFDEENDTVNAIEVSGSNPVQATSTQKGLNIGDTFDKMVELYGDAYTVSSTEDDEYQIYRYKFSDHYFEVWFQTDVITSWRIAK